MNSKHTPGPWHWSGAQSHKQFEIYTPYGLDGAHEHVCTVNNLPIGALEKRTPERSVANATLIAAAPEMLEAMKEFHAWFQEFIGKDGYLEINAPALDRFRAVIAKAEGREP